MYLYMLMTSQTFFMSEVQCKKMSMCTFNGLTLVTDIADILIKISVFTLLDVSIFLVDGVVSD